MIAPPRNRGDEGNIVSDEKNTDFDGDRPEGVEPANDQLQTTPDEASEIIGGPASSVDPDADAPADVPVADAAQGEPVADASSDEPVVDASSDEPVTFDTSASEAEPESVSDAEPAASDEAATDAAATEHAAASPSAPVQYGVGPLSIRETALVGVWALSFVFSFLPIYARFGSGASVWGAGIDWVLTIGVPTVAVFLLLLRRFSPQGIRRVGSLGIDQFASVAFSVSATVWLGIIWGSFATFAQTGVFIASWVVWVEFVLMIAGVVLTVVAPHLPVLGDDFRHRPEASAHRLARGARPVTPRPAAVRAPAPSPTYAGAPAAYEVPAATGSFPVVGETSPTAAPASDTEATTVIEPLTAPQAFWALAPEERDVLDETGVPLFRVGPTAWALVIEDRGGVFVVRHEDGRIGYLHDTRDVTRG